MADIQVTIEDAQPINVSLGEAVNVYQVGGGAGGAVDSVNGKPGAVTLAKGDVGLGNVDNTSDANKPVSTATQTALNAKQATLVSGTNIKTINGTTLLGAGDITITGGGGGGSSAQVDIYYAVGSPGSQSSYTWVKPDGAKAVHVFMVGAGSGGGSGRRGAAGSLRAGGGGGSPGRFGQASLDASGLPASVTVLVAKGGAGGAAVTTDDTNGARGGEPATTAFGVYTSHAPGGGNGGTAAGLTNAGNASAFGWQSFYSGILQGGYGGTGGGANPGDGQALPGGGLNPSGGGGGGGINASNVHTAGGLGGGDGGGAKGAAGGGDGGTGTPANTWIGVGGGGGGGNAAGAGGNGADGGYGAGGGGGGASVNGYVSGAGGKGGDGIVIVTTYF